MLVKFHGLQRRADMSKKSYVVSGDSGREKLKKRVSEDISEKLPNSVTVADNAPYHNWINTKSFTFKQLQEQDD
jgi:hypothetical protein